MEELMHNFNKILDEKKEDFLRIRHTTFETNIFFISLIRAKSKDGTFQVIREIFVISKKHHLNCAKYEF